VRAVAKSGVTGKQVEAVVPKYTVALWCASTVLVNDVLAKNPVYVDVQFLSSASKEDEQRAATYLRGTRLFSSVVLVESPRYY
jgi:hypothetical protein